MDLQDCLTEGMVEYCTVICTTVHLVLLALQLGICLLNMD